MLCFLACSIALILPLYAFAKVLLGCCYGVAVVFGVLRWLCYGISTCIGFDLVLARFWCGFVIPREAVWVWFW